MSDDERARRINLIGMAAHDAAKAAVGRLLDQEPITPEEASTLFGTGLLWPAVSYLLRVGVSKEEFLRVASTMYEQVEEDVEEHHTFLN